MQVTFQKVKLTRCAQNDYYDFKDRRTIWVGGLFSKVKLLAVLNDKEYICLKSLPKEAER